jgi:hypothetical protein
LQEQNAGDLYKMITDETAAREKLAKALQALPYTTTLLPSLLLSLLLLPPLLLSLLLCTLNPKPSTLNPEPKP